MHGRLVLVLIAGSASATRPVHRTDSNSAGAVVDTLHPETNLSNILFAHLALSFGNPSSFANTAETNGKSRSRTLCEGVKLDASFLSLLYKLLDFNGGDTEGKEGEWHKGWNGIDYEEWNAAVLGDWSKPMWQKLTGSMDEAMILKQGFNEDSWDIAMSEAYAEMGAADEGAIAKDDIDGWKNTTEYELRLARTKIADSQGAMDKESFEKFLFTVMLFRGLDRNGDGTLTWEEIQKQRDRITEPALDTLGKSNEEFSTKFGKDGLTLDEFYMALTTQQVFRNCDLDDTDDDDNDEDTAKSGSAKLLSLCIVWLLPLSFVRIFGQIEL